MNVIDSLAKEKRQLIERYSRKNNTIAVWQIASTLVPFFGCWYIAINSASHAWWLTAACMGMLCLLLLRIFVLMHECGHNALFSRATPNRLTGFFLGVLCGMPQYVWSRHHDYHHATNGNWSRYRGPLGTLTIDEYQALSKRQQRLFRITRNIAAAPIGGFLYLVVNPRITWIKGTVSLVGYLLREKYRAPRRKLGTMVREFETRYWKTPREFAHMTANNLVLLSGWSLMCWLTNPLHFFVIYGVTMSLAGGGGIILFAVQHNFEGAWAVGDDHWNYNRAAIEGTSFLLLPNWLNWFTADIAYHHIHHLSARIPNYNLASCHREYAHLFNGVPRLRLSQIPAAVRNTLWDVENQCLTSPQALSLRPELLTGAA